MIGSRKLSPGDHEYLTNAVACHDRRLDPGELLSGYYLSHGYPAGEWFGAGAQIFGLTGEVKPAQMKALFGEGRHPNADAIENEMIADGKTAAEALSATKLGRGFPVYSGLDLMRVHTAQAYKDYNLEHGRPVGAPIDAATRHEIRQEVQKQVYRDATGASGPVDPAALQTWLAEEQRKLRKAVSGYEMVFAPDKSVSVAWALAPPDERKLIANLVRQAMQDTLAYVEQNLAFTRAGNQGQAQVDVDGITVAIFEHWDSRAGDPHLHFHALISTKVRRSEDGKWTALDGRPMLAGTVTASEFFDTRTRDLFREHGARWTQRPANGVDHNRNIWQLAAVPLPLIKGFSQRTRQFEAARARRIVEFRELNGREPRPKEIFAIDRAAKLDGRPGKPPPKSLAEHTDDWHDFARDLVGQEAIDKLGRGVFVRGRAPAAEMSEHDLDGLAEAVVAVVSAKYAHFTRWHLEAQAHRQTARLTVPADDRAKLIDRVVDRAISSPTTLALEGATLIAEAPFLRRRSGESVFHEHHSTRYTTTQTLAEEGDFVAWAKRGGGYRVPDRAVRKALRSSKLNKGQQRMVTEFAGSGKRLQLALAPAGAGKTAAMKVLADLWRSRGRQVYAFGPSARAALGLGVSIRARPHTLHQLPTALEHGVAERKFPIAEGDLVLVDEAAMAGTHTLHTVVTYALNRGADVRLIGDDRQLAAVEAGGAIRLIALDVGAVRFSEVVRFKGHDRDEQAAASLMIRVGNEKGIDFYADSRRISTGSVETMRNAALTRWRRDLRSGTDSLLIVPTNEDTVALNLEARAIRLRHRSEPTGPEVDLHDGTQASTGDTVVTRHNHRRLSLFGGADFVKNGDTWRILTAHEGGQLTVRHVEHGARITLPRNYVRRYVELAYAATVNRVQGMTSSGNAHSLVPPTMTREQLYPAITRAQQENYLYVVTHHHVIDLHQKTPEVDPDPDKAARKVLVGVLNHTSIEPSATEAYRDSLNHVVSLATLVDHYNYAATYLDEDTYLHALSRHAPETLDAKAEAALVQTLRNANDLGWSPEQLLPRLTAGSPLTGTNDPAAVLASRITTFLGTDTTAPPAGHPDPRDVHRWRTAFDTIAPDADVENPRWNRVWRIATGAIAHGHDVEVALTTTAHHLAARHILDGGGSPDPMPDHAYAANALLRELDAQKYRGQVHTRTLPWQSRPDLAAARTQPGRREYLAAMNDGIRNRLEHLRGEAIRNPPAWTARLGPHPDNPITAWEWDEIVGLTAAYRETYQLDSDPDRPLGPRPETHGVRTHSWDELTLRWTRYNAPAPAAEPSPANQPAEFTADDALDYLDAERETHVETLDVLVKRYEVLARAGDEDRYLDLLARYVPATVNSGAEQAILNALADAQDEGWQAERLLHAVTRGNDFAWADAPDLALLAALRNYRTNRRPPARTANPTDEQTERWLEIVSRNLPHANVADPAWNNVWRHAAAGSLAFLAPDTALDSAAHTVAHDRAPDPDDLPNRVARALVAELAHLSRLNNNGPALQWLPTADIPTPGEQLERMRRLELTNAEVRDRVAALRHQVTGHPPAWAASLGPRPIDPEHSTRWDETLALAAAYRETFHVPGSDTTSPFGPPQTGRRARMWRILTAQSEAVVAQSVRLSSTNVGAASRVRAKDTLDREFHAGVEAAQVRHRSAGGTAPKQNSNPPPGADDEEERLSYSDRAKHSH
ncbi:MULTISPECIES: MobF family relaxase [Amycolatopsis]|uniref:MobF family relaxase n=1 Tax=Amycolatopsis albidoflavus TaxID=102226 RepID=A0ABW5HRQ8_9PSEU